MKYIWDSDNSFAIFTMSDSENNFSYLTGLDPIISIGCKVLIVGSFPSSISLIRGEYYANPRNDFWKIMGVILHMDPGLNYRDRVYILLSHSIGLWDVVCRCTRHGSADIAIRDSKPSHIGDLLIKYPDIRAILCNGRRAETGLAAALQNYSGSGQIPRVRIQYLPSSSPAHAINFTKKCASWMILLDLLKEDDGRDIYAIR
jgi:double-stranded uracil-DNA glycosylase